MKTCNVFILFKKQLFLVLVDLFSFGGKATVRTTCVLLYLLVAFLQIDMICFV